MQRDPSEFASPLSCNVALRRFNKRPLLIRPNPSPQLQTPDVHRCRACADNCCSFPSNSHSSEPEKSAFHANPAFFLRIIYVKKAFHRRVQFAYLLRSMKGQPKRYAGLTLLGNSEAAYPKTPKQSILETFGNPKSRRDYVIRVDCPDFTSLCPVTGQPDFAEILVEYVPDELCIETKSLKLYLASYRNVPSFNEEVINRILDDLVAACDPRRMRIEGRFAARGGLALSVMAEHSKNDAIAPGKGVKK